MKTCPICNTTLFDDMETCYGCMYTFGTKPDLEAKAQEAKSETHVMQPVPAAPASVAEEPTTASSVAPAAQAPIPCEPFAETTGPAMSEAMPLALLAKAATLPGWSIRFEMRDEAKPTQSWTMQLTPPPASAA